MSATTHPSPTLARSAPARSRIAWRSWLVWIPLAVVVLWAAVPLVWSFASSFKGRADFSAIPSPFFPTEPTARGYEELLGSESFWTLAWNSTIVAVISTMLAVTLSSVAAYGFARFAFRWRHVLLLFILIPRLVPRVSLIVPVYELMRSVGLLDTLAGLIIVNTGAAIPLATWIMIGFIGAIPKELDEAARVDGASTRTIFLRIIMPLSIPGLLTVTVLAFRDAWNEFPFALALTKSPDVRTLPYQLFLLKDSVGVTDYGLIQAFTVLSIIPILVIYITFEKYVVGGMTAGAVK